MNKGVDALQKRVDNIVSLSERFVQDDELAGQYARYLCVVVSGYFEEAVRLLLLDYTTRRSSDQISRFVRIKIQDLTNLKPPKLRKTLEEFSVDWAASLDARLDTQTKDALESVVTNRHSVAHGKKNVNVSLGRIKNYYSLIKPLVGILENDIIK